MPQHIEVPGQGVVEFPDGMSDDAIAAAIRQNFPEAAAPASTIKGPSKPAAQPRTSFLGDAFENARHGASAIGDLLTGNFAFPGPGRRAMGPKNDNMADTLFSDIGDDASISNILATAVRNSGKLQPGQAAGALMENFGQNPAGKTLSAIGGLNPTWNAVGTAVNRYANPAIVEATGMAPDNVDLAETLLPLIAGVPVKGKTIGGHMVDPIGAVGRKVGGTVKEYAGDVRKGLKSSDSEQLNSRSAKIELAAGQQADAFRKSQTVVAAGPIMASVERAFADPKNELYAGTHGKTLEQLQRLRALAEEGPLRLADINDIRSQLGDAVGQDSAMAGVMRNSMHKPLQAMTEADVLGGDPAGIQQYNQFLEGWKKKSRFDEVADMVKATDVAPNRADALQRKATNFVNEDSNLSGRYSPEEIAALRAVGEGGAADTMQKVFGSLGIGRNNKLIPGLAAGPLYGVLGPLGAALTIGGGTLVRGARNAAVRGRAERVLDMIENRDTSAPGVRPAAPLLLEAPRPVQTEPVQPEMVADWDGGVRPTTPLEQQIFDGKRSRAEDLGLTPDILRAQDANRAAAEAPGAAASEMGRYGQENRFRPVGDWAENPYVEPSGIADMLRNAVWGHLENQAAATKGAQVESMWQNRPAPEPVPEPAPPFDPVIPVGPQTIAASAQANAATSPIAAAMVEALQRKPTRITITKNTRLGPDGLPRVNLPE